MSVKKYLTLNGLTYFLSKIKSTMADELDGKSDVGHTHTKSDITDLVVDSTLDGTSSNAISNSAVSNALDGLSTVATSGDYDDLSNKPSIPTNTSDLNNDSGFVTLNDFDIPSKTSDLTNDSGFITSSDVPTSTSDLINDSNFVDTSNSAVSSGITSAKVTDYDSHIADTDIHVTTEDKANWNSKQGSLSQAQLDAIAQVATNTDDIATLQSGKADASHTHSSSDITDIDDYATKDYVDTSISDLVDNAPAALDTLKELSTALNDDANFASTVTTALSAKADSADLATVATSGSYNDLDDLPTIPANTSDLTNDSDFVVSSNLATVATSGDYDDLSNKPSIPTYSAGTNLSLNDTTFNVSSTPSFTNITIGGYTITID